MYHTSMVRRTLALVAGPTGIHYNNGRHYNTVPAGLLYDVPRLLDTFARELDGSNPEGVIIIAGVKPGDITDDAWTQAGTLGWSFGRPGSWVTCWRNARRMTRIHIGFLDAMDQTRTPLFTLDQEHSEIALLLGQYHEITGGPFHATPGVSGHGAIRELCKPPRARAVKPGGERIQAPTPKWMSDATHEQKYLRGAGPLIWKCTPGADHAGPQSVRHTFDVNAQYLAAARNARLAVDDLVHTGAGQQFDASIAGYWLINGGYVTSDDRMTNVMPPVVRGTGQTWVTTPVMEYLHQRHPANAPRVLDSFTAPGKTVLRPWAEKLRGARAELLEDAEHRLGGQLLTAVKATYTQSMGLLGRTGGRIYRRDWYDTIVDMARINLLRRIDKVYTTLGEAPTAVNVDAVTYRTVLDAGTVGLALGVGTGIGQFKHVSTVDA